MTGLDALDARAERWPCGTCTSCRLKHAQSWAIRCAHESQMHQRNCFLTLTYDGDHLPEDGALDIEHTQLFLKRLRKCFSYKKLRFFLCGEYGSEAYTRRPHYHLLLFGEDFSLDRIQMSDGTYTSRTLNKLWPKGRHQIGNLTYASAAYTAQYTLKKQKDVEHADYPTHTDLETGECRPVPPFVNMSRNPGLGSSWFLKYGSDVYPSDECVINGRKMRPPRYYDALLKRYKPALHDEMKKRRRVYTADKAKTLFELRTLEIIQNAANKAKNRELGS